MTGQPHFRAQAKSVRREARAKLVALRQARVARKRHLVTPDVDPVQGLGESADFIASPSAGATGCGQAALTDPTSAQSAAASHSDGEQDADLSCENGLDVLCADAMTEDALVDEGSGMVAPLTTGPSATPWVGAAIDDADAGAAHINSSARARLHVHLHEDDSAERKALQEITEHQPRTAEQTLADPKSSADSTKPDGGAKGRSEMIETVPGFAADGPTPEFRSLRSVRPAEVPSDTLLEPSFSDDGADESDRTLPLSLLPGIGPALIWLMNENGIENLSDLAGADIPLLMSRLGLIGQIIDLGLWVEVAHNMSSQNTRSSE